MRCVGRKAKVKTRETTEEQRQPNRKWEWKQSISHRSQELQSSWRPRPQQLPPTSVQQLHPVEEVQAFLVWPQLLLMCLSVCGSFPLDETNHFQGDDLRRVLTVTTTDPKIKIHPSRTVQVVGRLYAVRINPYTTWFTHLCIHSLIEKESLSVFYFPVSQWWTELDWILLSGAHPKSTAICFRQFI